MPPADVASSVGGAPETYRKPPAPQVARAAALSGLVMLCIAAGIVVLLDLTSATGRPIARTTISAYVFSHPAVFTTSVFALAAASLAVLLALVRRGWIGSLGPSTFLLALWTLGMVTVAIFPKHNWVEGPSLSGHIHRVASLVAFIALPIAVAIITTRQWRGGGSAYARLAWLAALGSATVVAYLVYAYIAMEWTGVPWWVAVDLGLVERLLVGLDVLALALLAVWAYRGDPPRLGRPG